MGVIFSELRRTIVRDFQGITPQHRECCGGTGGMSDKSSKLEVTGGYWRWVCGWVVQCSRFFSLRSKASDHVCRTNAGERIKQMAYYTVANASLGNGARTMALRTCSVPNLCSEGINVFATCNGKERGAGKKSYSVVVLYESRNTQ